MKKLIFIVAIFAIALTQISFAQDSTNQTQTKLSQLLNSYYNIKDALVAGDASMASASAEVFVKTANGIDYKVISEGNIHALLKDAGSVSETKDLKKQREKFATLSANMITLAKSIKLGTKPAYETYCPMKKSSWLSDSKTIKNPYYGNAMLSCGNVVETINQ
ncbi:MAG TPA: DUF3347 domain-containing protein [Niabella sp.]|jgi:hypothetical protein|uniref:DUF3347 domain-containing protein n=1 Tax=Agriterribacter sp. TaxID=2821509 RepID=UPI002B92BE32|nr:DUF3347 domain-containing protein [Agriterribacter sp.]HRO46610.1 DUF3347 domain-containing protein [Agriterribacter sp.]HUN03098.1 DUF3347 domain-containing protein [Niabella sp.]